MSGRLHMLKTWPQFFAAIRSGEKTAEMRKNDRGFEAGDYLGLCEYDPGKRGDDGFTGRSVTARVTHILHGPDFGVQAGHCMVSFKLLFPTIPATPDSLTAAAPDLLGSLAKLVGDLDDLIADSTGVSGLHRNGDTAPWGELVAGGQFETWLKSLDDARTVLAAAKGEPAPIEASQAGGQLPDGVAPTPNMSGSPKEGDAVRVERIIDDNDCSAVFLGHTGRVTGVHLNLSQRERYGSYAYDVQFANGAGYLWQKELVLVETAPTTERS